MSQLILNLLGAFSVEYDGVSLDIPRNKAKALLAYLAMPSGKAHSRDEVSTLLWSRSGDAQARDSLRQALYVLRSSLPENLGPVSENSQLKLDSQCVSVDVDAFRRASTAGTIWDLEQAAELYRGPFLNDFSLREDEFENWTAAERTRLEGIAISAMMRLAAHYVSVSRHDDAILLANRILEIDRLNEEAHRVLIQCYHATGNAGLARKQYDLCRTLLDGELGVRPTKETQRELDKISSGRQAPVSCADEAMTPAAAQQVRFCSAFDGTRIAYATTGEGPPLVKAPNWLTHLEYEWESPVWRHFLRAFSIEHTLVRFDQRGNGLSDWDSPDISFDAFVRDLEVVADSLGLDRFPLLGISQGCPISIAYAARHPERVSKLILYGGFVVGAARRDPQSQEISDAFNTMIRHGWGQDSSGLREMYTVKLIPGGTKEQMDWYTELMRTSASPENALRLREAMSQMDVSDLLPRVQAPTLVLHARNDAVAPFEEGRKLAAEIPDARFVALDGKNHILLEDEPAWPRFVNEVKTFLNSPP